MASTLEEDDPRQSSAALCISLNLLGSSFNPEFTHQCFPGEWIRGYQPKNIDRSAHHSSHEHHEEAKHVLQVHVNLSPSCRTCQVDVEIQHKPREIPTRDPKRRRIEASQESSDEEDDTFDDEEQVSNNNNDDNDSDYQDSEENIHPNDDSAAAAAGKTRARRMPVDEIIEHCSKALPTIVKDDSQDEDYLTSPVGTVIKEYQRRKIKFVMSLANGTEAADYHEQVQKLAIWFIETADDVDLPSNEGGGYWKVLYLFRKHSSTQYSLVGYMTIFHFHSPFKKPVAGTVARVCQVLILPPYQRIGHGKALLQQVYRMALDSNHDIVEINVEDPAPACTSLRNQLDFDLFRKSLKSKTPWLDSNKYVTTTDIDDSNFFTHISESDAIHAGGVACITPRQVQIAYEIYKLSLLPDGDEEVQKKYRLMVKKRLAKVHSEELGACASKQEKQALLAKIFDETLEQYKAVLKRNN